MNTIVPAISQGDTLKLEQPLDLPMNTPVIVHVLTDQEREEWLRLEMSISRRPSARMNPNTAEKTWSRVPEHQSGSRKQKSARNDQS
jgi:hypothetical protein